ncbi:MAG: hypothetical protein QXT26_04850, partial [Thermoproteota archaeon]
MESREVIYVFEYKTVGVKQELIGKIVKITQYVWAQITPEGTIRVGLTDYAAKHLKGIAHVMTEPVGKE